MAGYAKLVGLPHGIDGLQSSVQLYSCRCGGWNRDIECALTYFHLQSLIWEFFFLVRELRDHEGLEDQRYLWLKYLVMSHCKSSVFTSRQSGHVCVRKQRNGDHIVASNESSSNRIVWKHFLSFLFTQLPISCVKPKIAYL